MPLGFLTPAQGRWACAAISPEEEDEGNCTIDISEIKRKMKNRDYLRLSKAMSKSIMETLRRARALCRNLTESLLLLTVEVKDVLVND